MGHLARLTGQLSSARQQRAALFTAIARSAASLLLLLMVLSSMHTTTGYQQQHHLQSLRQSQRLEQMMATDWALSIHTYNSIIQHNTQTLVVRAQLRFICDQSSGSHEDESSSSSSSSRPSSRPSSTADASAPHHGEVHGFLSVFPISTHPPDWSLEQPHYVPPRNMQRPNTTITDRTTGLSTALASVGPGDQAIGLWRVTGQLQGPGPFHLQVAGAGTIHPLPHPLCLPQQDTVAAAFSKRLEGGLWNVLTTTSDTTIRPATLAQLVLEHNTYHRALGFSGTILRSNRIESAHLLQLPAVQQAVESEGLIIWPWEQEHIATYSTHFWQKPKNQLTLLGMQGRDARLAFFDLDEYLVINTPSQRQEGSHSSHTLDTALCDGKPLLDTLSSSGSNNQQQQSGSWIFIRFQAKSCPEHVGDQACWKAGRPFSIGADVSLLHDLCPMSYGHGKHIMVADRVDTISVHTTFSQSYTGNRLVNASCAHLLHFYSLLEARRAGVTGMLKQLPQIMWNVDPATGLRQVQWPEGLAPLEFETCKASPGARTAAVRKYNKRQAVHRQQQQRHKQRHRHGAWHHQHSHQQATLVQQRQLQRRRQ